MSSMINFQRKSDTGASKTISITPARTMTMSLADSKEEALKQGWGASLGLFGNIEYKNGDNKKVLKEIETIETVKYSKDQPYDFTQAINGETDSYIINKFINFISFRNGTDEKTDQPRFRVSINYDKEYRSHYKKTGYSITFFIEDNKCSSKDSIINYLRGRENSKTFELSKEEAEFLEQYIQHKDSGILLNHIDAKQVAMQYLFGQKNIPQYKGEIKSYKIKEGNQDSDIIVCKDENYINTIATILRKDFNTNSDDRYVHMNKDDSNDITVSYKQDKKDDNATTVRLNFKINDSDKIRIQYKEIYDDSGSKVIRKTTPYIVAVNPTKINPDTIPVSSLLRKKNQENRLSAIRNDKGEKFIDNFESSIIDYAIKHAKDYKNYLQSHFIKEYNQIKYNRISLPNYLATIDAKATALSFFINQSPQNNRIIREIQKIGIPSEILIIKLLEKLKISTSNGKEVSFLNNYVTIVKAYAQSKENRDLYNQFIKTLDSELLSINSDQSEEEKTVFLQMAFYMNNQPDDNSVNTIRQFFTNLNIKPSVIFGMKSVPLWDNGFTIGSNILSVSDLCNGMLYANSFTDSKFNMVNNLFLTPPSKILELLAKTEYDLTCAVVKYKEEVGLDKAIMQYNSLFNRFDIVTNHFEAITGNKKYVSPSLVSIYKHELKKAKNMKNILSKCDDSRYDLDKIEQALKIIDNIKHTYEINLDQLNDLEDDKTYKDHYIELLKKLYIKLGININNLAEIPLHPLTREEKDFDPLIKNKLKTYMLKNFDESVIENYCEDQKKTLTLNRIYEQINKFYIIKNNGKKGGFLKSYKQVINKYAEANKEYYDKFIETLELDKINSNPGQTEEEKNIAFMLAFYINSQADENVALICQFFAELNIESSTQLIENMQYANSFNKTKFNITNNLFLNNSKSGLELFAREHPELNCYAIKHGNEKISIDHAIRVHSNLFNYFTLIDSNDYTRYLTPSQIEDYHNQIKRAKQVHMETLKFKPNSIQNLSEFTYTIIKDFESERNPKQLRNNSIGGRTYAQYYIESLKEVYTKIGIDINDLKEVPRHPLDKNGNLDQKFESKLKVYLLNNFDQYKI